MLVWVWKKCGKIGNLAWVCKKCKKMGSACLGLEKVGNWATLSGSGKSGKMGNFCLGLEKMGNLVWVWKKWENGQLLPGSGKNGQPCLGLKEEWIFWESKKWILLKFYFKVRQMLTSEMDQNRLKTTICQSAVSRQNFCNCFDTMIMRFLWGRCL